VGVLTSRGSGAKFSVVLPAHNEEAMLPKTLSSVYALRPDEVFFCLDRCTDGSEGIVRRYADAYAKMTETTIRRYTESDGVGWCFRSSYLRRDAYSRSRNNIILNTAADIRLCPTILNYLPLIPSEYALISFHYYEHPWNIQCFERALINKFQQGFAGLLALSREAWLDSENIEDLKMIPRGEDTHLRIAVGKKYPTAHRHTHSLHLRPNETREDHYNRGQAIYMQVHHHTWKALLHSIVMVRPAVFAGFMHARRRDQV
jgi:glycosyltransferase involved in cell wall biosynthesis